MPRASSDADDLERALYQDWLAGRLLDALAILEPLKRRIVQLRVIERWEMEVVADMVDRPLADVRVLYGDALRDMRKFLTSRDTPGDAAP